MQLEWVAKQKKGKVGGLQIRKGAEETTARLWQRCMRFDRKNQIL